MNDDKTSKNGTIQQKTNIAKSSAIMASPTNDLITDQDNKRHGSREGYSGLSAKEDV